MLMNINSLHSYVYIMRTISVKQLECVFYVLISDLKEFIWLCLKAVAEPNSAKPTTIAKWIWTDSTENGK